MNTNPPISPDAANKRYQWEVVAGTAVYALLVIVCVKLLKHLPSSPLRITLALLPALPMLWVIWAVVRYLKRADELQRRVHLEALSIAAGITAFLSLTYGLLEDLGGLPMISAWWGFVVLDLIWAITSLILFRRYR